MPTHRYVVAALAGIFVGAALAVIVRAVVRTHSPGLFLPPLSTESTEDYVVVHQASLLPYSGKPDATSDPGQTIQQCRAHCFGDAKCLGFSRRADPSGQGRCYYYHGNNAKKYKSVDELEIHPFYLRSDLLVGPELYEQHTTTFLKHIASYQTMRGMYLYQPPP